ncbi:DUF6273 domain-containing protein [Oribacterium sp. FC2011]|uniref:DUF6273 domain-containing protein n=1 Tax=Oribacterium sp. FC2011 TaxID=1408311 RepID=UPI0012DEA342|nr:DUF6273 domain-containing protein [Oribacterium sp. FC2011]
MAKLECEICGGKLIARPDGLFECEYCGMQYDKLKIQQMVQEIKGTVKVEGTVQVEGKVQVEGGENIESLILLGYRELEQSHYPEDDHHLKALHYFEKALTFDAQNGDALLGKLITEDAFFTLIERIDTRTVDSCNTREKFWSRLAKTTDKEREKITSSNNYLTLMRANKNALLEEEIETYYQEISEWKKQQDEKRHEEQEQIRKKEQNASLEKQQRINRRVENRNGLKEQLYKIAEEKDNIILKLKQDIDSLQQYMSTLGFLNGKEKITIQEKIEALTNEVSKKQESYEMEITKLKLEMQGAIMSSRNQVQFGRYEMGGQILAIDWQILEAKEEKILIISKYAIDEKPFSKLGGWTSWESSDLRSWLNKSFIETSFDEDEQLLIGRTKLKTRAYHNTYDREEYTEETEDRIFLLSVDEVQKYFPSDSSRRLQPTLALKAVSKNKLDSRGCIWWLRSQVNMNKLKIGSSFLACVTEYGGIGIAENSQGKPSNQIACIRPAMWLDTTKV